MGGRVSVVVPAWNAAGTIRTCIESLFAQLVPIEILVVDDGSEDATCEIVRTLQPPSPHTLELVEQPHGGLGAARNAGLRRSRGSFVAFLDADDWVAPEAYAELSAAALTGHAELIIGGGVMVDDRTGAERPFQDQELLSRIASSHPGAFSPREVPDVFRLDTSACRRLYAAGLLQRSGFSFATDMLFEDVPAHFELLLSTTRVGVLDRPLYHYRTHHPGRITDRRDEALLTVFDALQRAAAALRGSAAPPEIWVGLIWLQSWVVRWLASTIDPRLRTRFARRASSFGRSLPRSGVVAFERRFPGALDKLQIVRLQRFGLDRTLLALVNDEMTGWTRRLLVMTDRMQHLAPLCGRLS